MVSNDCQIPNDLIKVVLLDVQLPIVADDYGVWHVLPYLVEDDLLKQE